MSQHRNDLRGISYSVTAFTLWVGADTFMKLAGEAHLPSYEVVGFLGLFASLLMIVKTASVGRLKTLLPNKPRNQLGSALLSVGSNLANAVALFHLPLTLFYIAVFTAPMMVALMAATFLGEKLKWQKITAVICGFLGVVIAVDPFHNWGGGDWIGYLAATISTVFFAINTVWLRVMTQSESADSLAFSAALAEGVIGFGLMGLGAAPVSHYLLLILFAMAAVGLVGNIFNYLAIRYTTASNVSQFHYTQIVAGALVGYLIWHEIPTWYTLVGAVIIIMSGLYIANDARRHQALIEVAPHI